MTSPVVLTAYNDTRDQGADRSVLCHAPFVSLNFDQSGQVTACCYNREYVLGAYPTQTVSEIWNGRPARALREAFLTNAHARGCDRCFDQVKSRNFSGALMRNFDLFSVGLPPRRSAEVEPPLVLEFELSNTCTLECVMCGGHWSSAIRAKRERLPPLPNPYDRQFVDQIAELLPSVKMVKFLGGEPFLITTYHEIWDRMRQANSRAELSITTSGAVVPVRPRRLLDDLRAHIVVSLDGATKETYEAIRMNARFETVMANIEDFRAYTRRQGTTLTVACCPMAQNWRELEAIVNFCEARDINLFFNTVTYPVASSLAGLSVQDLSAVVGHLEAVEATTAREWSEESRSQWKGLVNQLRGWLHYKRIFQWVRDRISLPTSSVSTVTEKPAAMRAGELETLLTAWRSTRREIDARLDVHRYSTADRARIGQYVDYLTATSLAADWHDDNASPCVADLDSGCVRDVDDFRLALDAMEIFHDSTHPNQREPLLGRLAVIRRAEGLSDAALRSLRADLSATYTFLATASDDAFARELSSLQ